jgi:hypothetical protein
MRCGQGAAAFWPVRLRLRQRGGGEPGRRRAATAAEGDPNILNLPAHSKGLGQPVAAGVTACPANGKKTCSAAKARASRASARPA